MAPLAPPLATPMQEKPKGTMTRKFLGPDQSIEIFATEIATKHQ